MRRVPTNSRRKNRAGRRSGLAWWIPLGGLVAFAAPLSAATLTEHVDLECRQLEPLELECDYRLLAPAELVTVAAESAGKVINGRISPRDPASGTTTILFLVDTSDPARAAAVEKSREHIARIMAGAAPHQRLGVANFDAELEVVCPLPCSPEAFSVVAQSLKAKGRTTELYRNVIEAIKLLRETNADRRMIVLMSDGLAEDLAYHHADVINAARREGVVISSIGYPRSVAQSIALQTLRRLSEETGGSFVQANLPGFEVPDSFFSTLLDVADNGGRVTFDLDKLQREDAATTIDVSLAFRSSEKNFVVQVPVDVPATETATAPAEGAGLSGAAAPVVAAAPPAPEPASNNSRPPIPAASGWFWYGLPAMVFSAILAAALAYAVMSRRRREEQVPRLADQHSPHAYLVSAYDDKLRYRIDHTPWRIGRSRNCELPLTDTSVSRLHAEIRRDALGQFTVQDLESLNGVFINGEAIELAHLDEADRVEIGDVGFTFTLHDEDYEHQEPTVLVRTRTPT